MDKIGVTKKQTILKEHPLTGKEKFECSKETCWSDKEKVKHNYLQ